jgi:hypothetical protein
LASALTVPHAVAALLLCVAGLAKLRSPAAAARVVGVAPVAVRAFSILEIGLGGWALLSADLTSSALMAGLYAAFAAVTIGLGRRGAPCGCFGSDHVPASSIQSTVSVALALVSLAGLAASAHGVSWILGRPPGTVTVLVLGTAGAVYGTVLAYSELPLLWRSWSAL